MTLPVPSLPLPGDLPTGLQGHIPPYTNPADYMLDLLDESTHYDTHCEGGPGGALGETRAVRAGLMTGQEEDLTQSKPGAPPPRAASSIPNFMESEHCQELRRHLELLANAEDLQPGD